MKKTKSRAYNRRESYLKAKHKQRLTKELDGVPYDNLHQYSKNKIHGSCSSCSPKTNNKTKRNIHANYDPSYNPSIRDRRKDDSAEDELKELNAE